MNIARVGKCHIIKHTSIKKHEHKKIYRVTNEEIQATEDITICS